MVESYIRHLQLQPHPEGGYYKETYRSKGLIAQECLPRYFQGDRNYSTAIYFLLQQGDFSAFHRIKSDECWHFYDGGTLLVHEITPAGDYKCTKLGSNISIGEVFQYMVPANHLFASEPAPGSEFSLVGCTVAPGFDFSDFEMAKGGELLKEFPLYAELIRRLCRSSG
jgi:predicted cupin superfamily sugar epimerase